MSNREEEHARAVLSRELGVNFRHHDDGSKPRMPDLLSEDGEHVAEVITTAPAAVREAPIHLKPVPEPSLPHCVQVIIPYTILGGATNDARGKIEADVRRWVLDAGCEYHWSLRDKQQTLGDGDPAPLIALGAYDDGVQALCVQRCAHSDASPHQIWWTVAHEASKDDPWSLIRQSLRIVDQEQHGGVQALAEKLDGYPNKHLVMYPFGPPGNLTAAFTRYVLPSNIRDLQPPKLNAPLADIHLWLMYNYSDRDVAEGLHLCSGYWGRFGTALPKPDLASLRLLQYPDK